MRTHRIEPMSAQRPSIHEWMSLETPKVAILVTSGCDGESTLQIKQALAANGALPRLVGISAGRASSINSPSLDIEVPMDVATSLTWDAMVIPNGEAAIEILLDSGKAHAFLKDQYRHRKPILLLGKARSLLEAAGIAQGEGDPAVLVYPNNDTSAALDAFIDTLARSEPPPV